MSYYDGDVFDLDSSFSVDTEGFYGYNNDDDDDEDE